MSMLHPLKKWRLDNKLTLEEGGEQCGISASYFHKIENGDSIPERDPMKAICQRTGLTPNDFYDFTPPHKKHEAHAPP